MNLVDRLFDATGALPLGLCLGWEPALIWLRALADTAIALPYLSIPVALGYIASRRDDLGVGSLVALFALLLTLGASTHLFDIWTIWHPAYGVDGLLKTMAAAVSIATALAFWPMVPRVIALPSRAQLQGALADLSHEIGRRREAVKSLRETEEQYRLLVNAVTDYAIFMLDADGIVTNWNPGAERIKGYRADEIVGRHFSQFYTPADRAAGVPRRALETAARDGRYETEAMRVRKGGERFWANVVIDPIRDDDGRVIGYAKVTRDISERIAGQTALRESEQRFQLLVNGVVDYAIFMLDPNGIVTNWNTGAERIKGYRAEEIIGQHFSRFYVPEDRASGAPERALEIAAREGKYEIEALRMRKDGSRFWANVVLDALRDDDGRLLGFAKTTRDVSERVRSARALDEARANLAQAQKMEAVGHLTGGIAHDFNNLLTAILGSVGLLLDGTVPLDPRARPYLETAARACQRGATLTRSLLAFARRQTLMPEVTDLNKLVSGMSELLRRTLGETVNIETVLAGGLWRSRLDPSQLENAVLNLALNARDAMPDGGSLTIETANMHLDEDYAGQHQEVAAGQYIMLAVTDTGTGMTPETIARAFEPFFTTKAEGKGSGLGLSQVYGFVKQSGGHIKIYSELGRGTTVRLYFPRVAGAQEAAREATEVPERPSGTGETILVVEDDPDVRQFTVGALRLHGYRPIEATRAEEALRQLEQNPDVRLLFTDVVLPGTNGRLLAERAQRLRPQLKVLFMTGYARNAIVHQGVLDPGLELLPKPFTPAALVRKIRQVLAST